MEKTIEYNGELYTVRRCRNIDDTNILYFKRMTALMFEGIAAMHNLDTEAVAVTLLDYAYVSGLSSGGTALLTRGDTDKQFYEKCEQWLINDNLRDLKTVLIDAVNEINTVQPDTALRPVALPNLDPKVSSVAKSSRKRRVSSG